MADDTDGLVISYLRRIEAKLDGLRVDVASISDRLDALDMAVLQLQSAQVAHHASLSQQLNRLSGYMERLERRLGIPPA